MRRVVTKIFRSAWFSGPVIGLSLLFIALLVYYASLDEMLIFPNSSRIQYDSYTDAPIGGNSQIKDFSVTDSLLLLRFRLNERITSPYVGIVMSPARQETLSAGKHNQLLIRTSGRNIDRIGISLSTTPAGNNRWVEDEMLYHAYLNISEDPESYKIHINRFRHPDWWRDLHQLPESGGEQPDLDHLLHINIGSAFSPDIDKEKTLEIYTVSLTRNNSTLFVYLGVGYAALVLVFFGLHYLVAARKYRKKTLTVAYQPLETGGGPADPQNCLDYISSHYNNSLLSIDLIAEETGLSPRRIAQTISEKYACNFKTYLNRIRIHEAKRFLLSSELTVGEIAYKVGFNTQSHFNRVFKTETGLSPSEYRSAKKD